jgi:long-chain acyl-CoA synthetase
MLGELLERQAADRPDHPALIRGNETLSWRQLHDQVCRLSSGLADLGVGSGDSAAILMPNSAALVTTVLALSRLGAQVLPLHTELKPPEVRTAIQALGQPLIFAADSAAVDRELADRVFQASREDFGMPSVSRLSTDSVLQASGPVAADAPFYQLLTSGSTGTPRRVIRSQASLCRLASSYCEACGLTDADRTLCVIPLHHGHGLCAGLLAPLFSGGTLVLEPAFERRATLRLLREHQITTCSAPPFIFSILADTVEREPRTFPELRFPLTAGAPLHRDVWHSVHARMGIGLRQLYGASETGVIAVNTDVDPTESPESVGRPLPGVEVAVGVEGDVRVRSRHAATWSAPLEVGAELTRLADDDGWVHMADVARWDAAGRLHIIGRQSRFINVAGRKVNPVDVEAVLASFPNVTKASVVAMRDEQGNESAKAVVYCSQPVAREALTAFCRERLAAYKVPRVIELRDDAQRLK